LLLFVLAFVTGVTSQWIQIGKDIDGENPQDYAGGTQGALAMNELGTTLVVGASGHDSGGDGAGHVRVFDFSVDGYWEQRGSDIQGEFAGDGSGASVVVSADGAVVGIGEPYSEAGNTERFDKDFGQVRVFKWKDGSWVQRGQAIAGAAKYDYLSSAGGLAMSASGLTVVVGAAEHDGPAGLRSGHVRVFDWDDGSDGWVQRGGDMYGEGAGDWFGVVATSAAGNTVAVGALFNDGDEEAGPYGCEVCRGSVQIFDWDDGSDGWVQRGDDIDGEEDHDFSGSSVAMNADGNVVAVGSPRTNAPYGDPERGSVTVYEWNGSDWQKRGTRIEGEADGDISGSSLAISSLGDTVAIGAYLNSGGSDTEGHVRVFDWDDGSDGWVQRGDDIDGENKYDYSGYSLAMSAEGDKLASGARFTDDAGYFAGHARVFQWSQSPVSIPTNAPIPVPAVNPVPMPTDSSCRDSTTWYKRKTWKNCRWVSENTDNRCSRKGNDGTYAYESCLAACGCSTDVPIPAPTTSDACADSTTWYKRKTWKNCHWVSKNTDNRCSRKGNDGTYAYESCLAACGCR